MAKQHRIALKLYEWVEKRPYFHKMARKKEVWLSIEPSTIKSYSSASGRFSHSGSQMMNCRSAFVLSIMAHHVKNSLLSMNVSLESLA